MYIVKTALYGYYIGTPPWRKRSHAEAELDLGGDSDSEPELDPWVALAISHSAEVSAAYDPYEYADDETLVEYADDAFAENADDDEEDAEMEDDEENAFAEDAETDAEEHEEDGLAQDDGYEVFGAEEEDEEKEYEPFAEEEEELAAVDDGVKVEEQFGEVQQEQEGFAPPVGLAAVEEQEQVRCVRCEILWRQLWRSW